MTKPKTAAGYDELVTGTCERVLVTLLRNIGPWKESIFLVGGLVPRYLVKSRPPQIPAHAGTSDVDLCIKLELLADTKAYSSLEANLRRLGFERCSNAKGAKVSWRWQIQPEDGPPIILEFLADNPEISGGKVRELPTQGSLSALNVPHASIVFDMHDSIDVTVETLGVGGIATETVRYANIVSYVAMKSFAFDDRNEPKDAHDLVYCLQFCDGGPDEAATRFRAAMEGEHGEVLREALVLLSQHFVDDDNAEGYRKVGPVAAAKFELGENDVDRERRILRQREVSDVVMRFLKALG